MRKKTAKKPPGKAPTKNTQWTSTSRLLRNLEPEEMLDLFQKLYSLSPENAKFIDSRFRSGSKNDPLEEYRQKIDQEFFPQHELVPSSFPRMGWMKSLIRDYCKGTGDLAGTTELMVTFLEYGMKFAMDFHVGNEQFYNSLLSGMRDLTKMLTKKAPHLFPAFRDRLLAIVRSIYGKIGWGCSDGMRNTVVEICQHHGLDFKRTGDRHTGFQFEIVEMK
jgi:hypothetical protein